jgi:hypothetical protein
MPWPTYSLDYLAASQLRLIFFGCGAGSISNLNHDKSMILTMRVCVKLFKLLNHEKELLRYPRFYHT